MNFLRLEFKNNQFVKAAGDLEDFIEWLGEEPVNYLQIQTSPVFERLGLGFTVRECGKANKKRQATIHVLKDSTFLRSFTRLSGKRTYSKSAAVVSALLALWELEVYRKVNTVRQAFGVGRSGTRQHYFDMGEINV